ncbi:MAG TPA: histidine phosphatase family protein [Anaerolineales bacterium]|nr:histidine phosphatase family protein [Anaerolineales bacterium]
MTTILLVRHGETDFVGRRLSGWARGVHLNARGREQAGEVAKALGGLPLRAIYSSPLERALETAKPLAQYLGCPILRRRDFIEVNYGEYTGRTFASLRRLALWQEVHRHPARVRFPGGETFIEVQQRVARALEGLCEEHPRQMVAAFAHGDVIRLGLAYSLGIPLDLFQRLTVSPASISALEFGPRGTRLIALNHTAGSPLPAVLIAPRMY